MKHFLKKLGILLFVFFLIVEIISRVVLDPTYYKILDVYSERIPRSNFSEIFKYKKTEHVDYLFIGSSRVGATINSNVIKKYDDQKIVIVASKGMSTPGLHYQALKNRLEEYPNYLRGSTVFLEYPGPDFFTEPFETDKLRVYEPLLKGEKAMPHFMLPFIDGKDLLLFLKESNNRTSVKADLVLLYCFSSYRTISLIKERYQRLDEKKIWEQSINQLASEAGIRNDNFEFAIEKALIYIEIGKSNMNRNKLLTPESLNVSTLSKLNQLIINNGGRLYLYKMPLHSKQKSIYLLEKAVKNDIIFNEWAKSKNIDILEYEGFIFGDCDFPDIWHLAKDRRDEFTSVLYRNFKLIHPSE